MNKRHLKVKETSNSMKFSLLLVFVMVFSLTAVAAESFPSQKVNEQFSFCQICNDATFITLSSIETPDETNFTNINMTSMGSGSFCYNYTPTEIGIYSFRGISDGCVQSYAVNIDVTPSGDKDNIGFFFLVLLLSGGVIVVGFSMRDAPITILGSMGFYFLGLYVLFFGINGMKDTVYTWAIGLIILGLAMYISIRSSYELIVGE